jgi:hypothetical protein
MAIVNNTHKKAAKAALALTVASRKWDTRWAAQGVAEAAAKMGLQLGDMGTLTALTAYANGVADQGEAVSNRRWAQYPVEVKALASRLANAAEAAIEAQIQ